jgi:hypothetical protein
MKKLSLVFAAMFFSAALYAQLTPTFGLKGGVNLSQWKIEDAEDDALKNRVGFHIGLLSHIHLSDQIGLQPEVQYSLEGTEQEFAGEDFDYKLGYLNVPIMLQYMFDNGFRLEAGPQFGFLLSAEQEGDVNEDIKDLFKPTNVGLGVGLNYLSHSGFGIGGRYIFGLSDISDVEGSNEIKTRNLQISVFYMFDSQHKAKSR